jgi:three-Cys-motif partner protein
MMPMAELKETIAGSAVRALSLANPFDRYLFIEKYPSKLKELEGLSDRFPALRDRMRFECADANLALATFVRDTDWRQHRAVVFLDPFGNSVAWPTVLALARTRAIDLWYLFPAGLGVHRQIGRDGTVDPTHEASLDMLLGTPDWRTTFITETESDDLFGATSRSEKVATPRSITLFMIKRLREVFKGLVLDEWLPLGSRNIHMYSLLFATANPSPKAIALADRLARAVLKS